MLKSAPLAFILLVLGATLSASARADAELENLSAGERKLTETIRDIAVRLSTVKRVEVSAANSPGALILTYFYDPSDEEAILGRAGNTERAIRTLANELAIAHQRDEARNESREFKLANRKIILVRFVRQDR